jgi:hypothetical protein
MNFLSGWDGTEFTVTEATAVLLYQPRMMMDVDECGNQWNDWQGKPKYSDKSYPSAALFTTNPT